MISTTAVTQLLARIWLLSVLGQIHILASLADVLPLTQVVDVSETFARLAFGLDDDFLDLWIVRADEHLGAVEANAAENFDCLREETDVKDGLGQINVSEVTRALCEVSSTCLATRVAIDNALTWIHQTSELQISEMLRKT